MADDKKKDEQPPLRTIGRQVWPAAAQAKGVITVPQRKRGHVQPKGGTQSLDVRQAAQLQTFERVRVVEAPGNRPKAKVPTVKKTTGGPRQVPHTQLVREPSAQRQVVQAAQGEAPTAVGKQRGNAGMAVRVLGQPVARVGPNLALRRIAVPRMKVRRREEDGK